MTTTDRPTQDKHPTPWSVVPASGGSYVVYDANTKSHNDDPVLYLGDDLDLANLIVDSVNACSGRDPAVVAELIAWAEKYTHPEGHWHTNLGDLYQIASRLRGGPDAK